LKYTRLEPQSFPHKKKTTIQYIVGIPLTLDTINQGKFLIWDNTQNLLLDTTSLAILILTFSLRNNLQPNSSAMLLRFSAKINIHIYRVATQIGFTFPHLPKRWNYKQKLNEIAGNIVFFFYVAKC
jgi:hypothetical protein